MAEPARSFDPRTAGVVRPISRAAHRRCSRPGCPTPATATLAFRYRDQHATLVPLAPDGGPETYDLCGDHADRTRPPHGWTIADERPVEEDVEVPDATDLGSERTVAVLAAALRGTGGTEAPAAAPDLDVDTAALDAIVAEPFAEPDLFGTVDEADPVTDADVTVPSDALTELSALSGDPAGDPVPAADDAVDVRQHEGPEDHGGAIVEQVPARTVPGAHRPD